MEGNPCAEKNWDLKIPGYTREEQKNQRISVRSSYFLIISVIFYSMYFVALNFPLIKNFFIFLIAGLLCIHQETLHACVADEPLSGEHSFCIRHLIFRSCIIFPALCKLVLKISVEHNGAIAFYISAHLLEA